MDYKTGLYEKEYLVTGDWIQSNVTGNILYARGLKGLDTIDRVSAILYKRKKFCELLSTYLNSNPTPKRGQS